MDTLEAKVQKLSVDENWDGYGDAICKLFVVSSWMLHSDLWHKVIFKSGEPETLSGIIV